MQCSSNESYYDVGDKIKQSILFFKNIYFLLVKNFKIGKYKTINFKKKNRGYKKTILFLQNLILSHKLKHFIHIKKIMFSYIFLNNVIKYCY